MAIRTTQQLVAGIIEVDSQSISDLSPFILTASELVDEVCATKLKADGTAYYTDVRLELIERWLAAHFYAIRDPRKDMEKAGKVFERNQYKLGLGLEVTTYGQQAKFLDTAGGLAALDEAAKTGGKPRLSISWLGTEED